METTGNKALIFVRVSTVKQELETQKADLVKLALYDGWTEEQLEYIEGYGASAIKIDALYRQNIELLKAKISSKEVSCVYIWEISRLARDRTAFEEVLKVLVDNKCQLVILNPQILKLLNKNGELEGITMMVFDFLKNMATTEMLIKKERFARGRELNKLENRFNGGVNGALYGYTINEVTRKIEPNPQEAKIVNRIFTEYAKGTYSVRTLAEALSKEGIKLRDGRKITENNLNNIIRNGAYIGYSEKTGRTYQPIVERALWDKVEALRTGKDKASKKSRESKNHYLGTKIVKCLDCGGNFTANSGKYVCYHHLKAHRFEDKCENTVSISVQVMDGLLWRIAREDEILSRMKYNSESLPKLQEELDRLNSILTTIDERFAEIDTLESRVWDAFTHSTNYTEKQRDGELAALNAKRFTVEADRVRYTYERDEVLEHLERIESGKPVDTSDLDEYSPKQQRELVEKHIVKATVERGNDGGKKCLEVVIYSVLGRTTKYLYYYTAKNKNKQLKKLS